MHPASPFDLMKKTAVPAITCWEMDGIERDRVKSSLCHLLVLVKKENCMDYNTGNKAYRGNLISKDDRNAKKQ
jgi:hypothetical protein